MVMVEKICGADVELGNFLVGTRTGRTPSHAAAALLREIQGVPHSGTPAWRAMGADMDDPQDEGRRFLATNGGCAYIDLNHLEICLPEVRSAWDHLACWHAMLRLVRTARARANRSLEGGRVEVLINNSDGLGASYGSHVDLLVTRRAWDDMFTRKLHPLLFLAAYQASSIVFTGQGKVGSENGAPAVAFQISQRADFIETLVGPQTTYHRPLVNSRDEPLCGVRVAGEPGAELARLHVICYDSTLAHAAHLLKIGVLQIVLAMIEAGRARPSLALDDAVAAMRNWSHDPRLEHRERLADGKAVTAVELQRLFVEEARPFVEGGECDHVVPRAAEIFALWDDTVTRFERGEAEALARRIDWVLKLSMLDSIAATRGLEWSSPTMKHLDHLFASVDPDDGLFWACERQGLTDRHVPEAAIERFLREPPDDTRAWTRAMLLRTAGTSGVAEVGWDVVRIRSVEEGWIVIRRADLPDPRESWKNAPRDAAEETSCDSVTCSGSDRLESAMSRLPAGSSSTCAK